MSEKDYGHEFMQHVDDWRMMWLPMKTFRPHQKVRFKGWDGEVRNFEIIESALADHRT